MTSRSRSLGTIALVATAALWGSNHVVARAARETVPLPALVFWRWALAALALTAIALPAFRLAWPEIRPRLVELAVGGAIGVGLFSYFLLGGAYQSLALEVGFINATTPIWVLLIGLLTGRLIPTMVGNLFYLFGVATNGPARAAIFLYLSPLFSAALAIGWLGEQIAWYHLAGVVAILTGLYLVGRSAPSGAQASPQHDRAEVH